MPIDVTYQAGTYVHVRDLISTMAPGQALVYHVGALMRDRKTGLEHDRINGAAQAAWEAHERGDVLLLQRKLAPLKFEYIALKRARDAAKGKKNGDARGKGKGKVEQAVV